MKKITVEGYRKCLLLFIVLIFSMSFFTFFQLETPRSAKNCNCLNPSAQVPHSAPPAPLHPSTAPLPPLPGGPYIEAPPPPPPGGPYIDIDGNIELENIASSGDGSAGNPFIIENYVIDAGSLGGHGISIKNTDKHFIIRNCTVINGNTGYAGINLESMMNGRIINNTLNNNYYGVRAYFADQNLIANNTLNNNYYGVRAYFADQNLIANNTANNNDFYGIWLSSSCNDNIVANNTANNNDFYGIWLSSSCNDNIVTNNTANYNFYVGIMLYATADKADNNTVVNNTANHNAYGISIRCNCHDSKIINNTVNHNTNYGIELCRVGSSSPSGITLINNTANFNTMGIRFFASDSNTASFNTVNNNSDTGICLENSDFNTITWNVLSGNARGIYEIYCTGNIIANNNCPNPPGNGWGNGGNDNEPPYDSLIWLTIPMGITITVLSGILFYRIRRTPTEILSNPKEPTKSQFPLSGLYCHGCGKRNAAKEIFCKYCGYEL